MEIYYAEIPADIHKTKLHPGRGDSHPSEGEQKISPGREQVCAGFTRCI